MLVPVMGRWLGLLIALGPLLCGYARLGLVPVVAEQPPASSRNKERSIEEKPKKPKKTPHLPTQARCHSPKLASVFARDGHQYLGILFSELVTWVITYQDIVQY